MDHPEIEFLILADCAEVVGGKLYLLGGGWQRMTVADFKTPVLLGVVASIMLPWRLGTAELTAQLSVESETGSPVGTSAPVTFRADPDPSVAQGHPIRAMVAGTAGWVLPGPGVYRMLLRLEGAATRAVLFETVSSGVAAMLGTMKLPTSCQA